MPLPRVAGVSHGVLIVRRSQPYACLVKASVRSRRWLPLLAVAATPVFMATMLLIPENEREGSNSEILLIAAGTAVVLALIVAASYLVRGSDSFTADDRGLRTHSKKHGNHDLAWSEIAELGWVVQGRYTSGGLAGRKHDGGSYEAGGPNIAGWLAQPRGRVRPTEGLSSLQSLCQQHGVAWKYYAPAEVM